MKIRKLLLLAVCLGFLPAPRAGADPYASGVTNIGGAISWVLNEPATDVKILFNNGQATNDLGAAPVVGSNTFRLEGYTNFAIVVSKAGSNALNQISSDNNINNNFYGPRGVAVNKNPKTWNFGRVYVASAYPGTAGQNRTTTRGVYVMDAASEDFLGLGGTAALAGMSLGGSLTYGPFKLFVGPDDTLYVGDASTGTIGGVWRTDPSLISSTNIFGLADPANNAVSSGTNFGRAIGTPNAFGSLAGGNLVLTLTSWDLNLTNSAGKFGASKTSYQNIYRYNINSGPLPWKSFPTVLTNPINLGFVNTVIMDVEIAPDGKYFITAERLSPSDGYTNVCVLNSNATSVLWDSKTQSADYFGDTVNDHLSIQDYSIAVSPDDKYVVIQGVANNNFLLMSLTNGIPDISTLTTNTTVGANGGSTCYAATWDAADNIYVTSGGSETLRVFSLGLTTTCITSNDATCTNGSFQFTGTSAALAAIEAQPTNVTAQCSSNAVFSVGASGVSIAYQWCLAGSGAIGGATNSTLTLPGVTLAQSGQSYSVVVSNSLNSVTSQVAVLTVVDTIPPVVTLNGSATTNILQGMPFIDPGATATDTCAGSLPVTTNGNANVNVAGVYEVTYQATDQSGNSGTATRTVYVHATNGPPGIVQQPASVAADCTASVVFTVIAEGALPLSYQWYDGAMALSNGTAISGATNSSLTLEGAVLSEIGSYTVVVTNSASSITSQVATLSLTDLTQPVVTVLGSEVITVARGAPFTDPGATAMDPCVGNLAVTTNGSVNVNQTGTYVITYTATNSTGQTGTGQRTIDVIPPASAITAGAVNLVPLPVTLQARPGLFTLCPSQPTPAAAGHALTQILFDGASRQTAQYLAAALFKSTGYQFPLVLSTATNAIRSAILITTSNAISTLGAEGYELTVAPDSVFIRAPAQGGTFYGAQTFLQLLPPQIYSPRIVNNVAWVAPCVYIEDYPRFSWRGVMVDAARHFFNKDEIKQVLDVMATQKLNTFHWHLVDDQGWRIELTNYPNVAAIGAWRGGIDYGLPPRATTATNASGQYGGYYTQADAQEIVAYAAERHITVVPEIEMPCHSTAGLASYPQFSCGDSVADFDMDYPGIDYNVDLYSLGRPGTMAFLEDALSEVMGVFPGKYIHCGGDEVISSQDVQWNSYTPDITNMEAQGISPNGDASIVAYQHWFSTVIADFVQSKGRMMMGWTEFENGGVLTNAALMDWEPGGSSEAVPVAEAGMPVVMTQDNNCYVNYVEGTNINLPYEPYFIVGGSPSYLTVSNIYTYNPIPSGLPSQYVKNILGAQCTLFGEYVPSLENVMFKIWPRGSAMAEMTWSPTNLQSYTSFTDRLPAQEQRFTQMGVNYDHEIIPQIGSWSGVSTSGATLFWNVTTNITAAGEIDVNFWSTGGTDDLAITSVALMQNGAQVDIDTHDGLAGPDGPDFTLYVLHLPETKPGATYTIQAVVAGSGGANNSGTVYLPNWN